MNLARWVFFVSFVSNTAFADDVNLIGTMDYTLKIPATLGQPSLTASTKQIKLLKLALSNTIQKEMSQRIYLAEASNEQFLNSENLPTKVQLGMNDVPVLDQGRHGTCATFSATAAIDAALNKGDYISQLCLLQLGNFLEPTSYISSGWNGSYGTTVLNEINIFGVVSKLQQSTKGCGGLKEYPAEDKNAPTTQITPLNYHQMSTSITKLVGWTSILDEYSLDSSTDMNKVMVDVKTTLTAHDRLSFGIILVDINLGTVGAVGKYHVADDTWLLTPEIIKDTNDFIDGNNPSLQYGGHGLVITGYDDDAVAIDDKGREHKGLLTLRNSWGKAAGDQGNYYMSYDYFASLVTHIERIRKLKTWA